MNTPSTNVLTLMQDTERLDAIEEKNYEDQVVKTATQNDDGTWWLSAESGWTFFGFRVPEHMDPPLPGDNYRTYGQFGQPVIGGDLRGKPCWFESKVDRDAKADANLAKQKARRKAQYEAEKDNLQAQYDALPETLRKRIDRFVANCPEDWWVEYGGYEIFALGVATKIAAAATSVPSDDPVDLIAYFAALPYEDQLALLPDAGLDQMSGNQFNYSVQIAGALVDDEHRIGADFMLEWGHGAMTPLTGCESYGCTAPSEEVIWEVEAKVAAAKAEVES